MGIQWEQHVKTAVTLPQSRSYQKPDGRAETGPSEGGWPCQHLKFVFLRSRNVRQ